MLTHQTIETVYERAKKKGSHFFDADTMRYFRSIVYPEIVTKGEDIYFITSEKHKASTSYGTINEPRKYTIRKCTVDGNIVTVGEFQAFGSLYYARKALEEIGKN